MRNRAALCLLVLVAGLWAGAARAEEKAETPPPRGYQPKPLADLSIDASDGIDVVEAGRLADWLIENSVHLEGSGIVSYSAPVSDGLNWRVEVKLNNLVPWIYRRKALSISKISGRSFGVGWRTTDGLETDLGPATYRIEEDDARGSVRVLVRLKRETAPEDEKAKFEIGWEAVHALRLVNEKMSEWFEPAQESQIRLVEGAAAPGKKDGKFSRVWTAIIPLRLKPPAAWPY